MMVRLAGEDLVRPVELLEQHHARELVRERHRPEREPLVAALELESRTGRRRRSRRRARPGAAPRASARTPASRTSARARRAARGSCAPGSAARPARPRAPRRARRWRGRRASSRSARRRRRTAAGCGRPRARCTSPLERLRLADPLASCSGGCRAGSARARAGPDRRRS